MSEAKAKGKRSTPKGLYVNLPEDLKKEVDDRCEDSFRTPGAEIAWIVREYLNQEAEGKMTDIRPAASATGT